MVSALKTYEVMAQDSLHPEKVIEQGCRKILTRAPNHLPARLSLAEVCMKTGNWEGVLAAYEPIMKSPPIGERLRILKRWVEAAFRAGKLKEAREQGLALLAEAKDDLSFMILVIKILEDCGDYQKAFDIFRAAAELFPEDETLHRMKRTVADNKKRNRMEELQRLDAEGKLTAQLNYEKADLHREFDQTHLAISHYQKASDDPELADMAMTKLAICLCDRRLFDLADETLDKINLTKEIVAKNPELKDMYYWMADTLEQELFKVAALKYFKRLFSVDASYKDVVIRLEKLSAK
ncbi:hypothetical protein HY256_02955 [Candidatus Sumerlaeota bacterium]|nr:hypothetical protein [Candidatus Sumerlaeota bacterium]